MRKTLAALVLAAGGCIDFDAAVEEHRLATRGLDKSDLTAPPTDHAIRARIVNDIRNNLLLIGRLDDPAWVRKEFKEVEFRGARPFCAKHNVEVASIELRPDPSEHPYAASETAFYCEQDNHYWYHYVGGRNARDVWMGPFPTGLQQRPRD
jgi:hypothetical protein